MSGRNTPRTGLITAVVGGLATDIGALLVANDISLLLGVLGLILGSVIPFVAVVGYFIEGARRIVGVLLILIAFLAIPTSLAGVLIGFLFTLVAGYVFLTVQKIPDLAGAIICWSCKRDYDGGYRLCPYCGAQNTLFEPAQRQGGEWIPLPPRNQT